MDLLGVPLSQGCEIDTGKYSFKFKEKIHLDKSPLYNSSNKVLRFISGDFYVQNPNIRNGLVKINVSPSLCDDLTNIYGWVEARTIRKVEDNE